MAAIRKLRSGKFEVQIRRKGFAPVSRTFHRKADAEEWARHTEVKADRGDLPTPVKVLDGCRVRDILERYRDEITVEKRSADTEIYLLNAFLRHPIANLTLAQITPAHFSAYRDKRLKEVKPGTVNRELSIIKHAFDVAARDWDIPLRENPLAKLKKLKVDNARTRRMSEEEFKALMDAASKSRNKQIIPLIRFAVTNAQLEAQSRISSGIAWANLNFKKPSVLRSAINLGPISIIIRLVERWRIPDDPNFSLGRYKEELHNTVSSDDWYRFKNVRSKSEFDSLVRDINEEYEDRNIIKYASGGAFLYGVTWFVPLLLFPIFPFLLFLKWIVRHAKIEQRLSSMKNEYKNNSAHNVSDNKASLENGTFFGDMKRLLSFKLAWSKRTTLEQAYVSLILPHRTKYFCNVRKGCF
jgi:hypothetical protein